MSLLRTKIREKVSPVSTVGQPPDRLGKIDCFCVFIANFYSLKTKKIPAGRLVLGDWLGHYIVFPRVEIFAAFGVRRPVSDDQGLLATKGQLAC